MNIEWVPAVAEFYAGHLDEGVRSFRELLADAERSGHLSVAWLCRSYLAIGHVFAGDLASNEDFGWSIGSGSSAVHHPRPFKSAICRAQARQTAVTPLYLTRAQSCENWPSRAAANHLRPRKAWCFNRSRTLAARGSSHLRAAKRS